MNFYTNVACVGSHIYYRGVKDGRRVREKIEYEPTLYTKSADLDSPFRTLHGEPLEPKRFNSIYDARDFVKTYEDVVGFTIYGNSRYEYAYIAEEHPEELIEWTPEKIVIAYLDIEVGSENGFPKPEDAQEELTAITVKLSTSPDYFVFGCGEFTSTDSTVQYIRCADEDDLIRNFLAFWKEADPDVVSGWSIKTFDIPYLVNRLKRLYGDATANRLSPWGRIYEKQEHLYNREMITYDLVGISILDYLQLFRKFSPNASQESYRLDYIASVELKKKKLSYADYDSLHDLYKKNYQLFIEYNIQDVRLVEELNAKGGLIDMALTLAFDNKTNFDDVFSQVLMWDCICYNFLLRDNIIVPPKVHRSKDKAYEGAYVKDPQIGFFKWVASLDLNSLYPHLMMQYNLSPETLVEPDEYSTTLRDILVAAPAHSLVEPLLTQSVDLAMLRENGVTMTPNGQFFRISKQGFLPKIMQKMYNDRVGYKKKMIESKKLYEKETDPEARKKLEFLISRYKNLQLAKKVSLNSAYGACGNEHFRFFDIRIAEAVTLAGQLSIRWIENALNRYMNGLLKTEKKDYIIASDTDSVYLHLAPLIDKVFPPGTAIIKIIDAMDTICREKLTPFITQQYGELALYMNAYEQKMEMKRESLCFPGSTWVETSSGKKHIRDIVVGDSVLTHAGRYKKVTKVYSSKYTDDFVEIRFRRGRGDLRASVKSTPDHPFLVERGGVTSWVASKDIVVGDIVFSLSKLCPKTRRKIPKWHYRYKTWNAAADCESTRKKISTTVGKKIYTRSSFMGSSEKHMVSDILPYCLKLKTEGWSVVPVGTNVIPDIIGYKDGKIVIFEIEKTKGNLLDFKKSKYTNHPIAEWVDEIRWIESTHIRKTHRGFWYEDAHSDFIKIKVAEVSRKRHKHPYNRKYETVYNIEVDEDHSYVANDIIVHNCDTAIWTAKKRYILNVYDEEGVRFAEPQMKIQGLEAIKSSTPSACRVKIKEALKLIIKGDQPALHEFIAQFRSEFKRQNPEDIAFPRSVNGLTKYRSGAYHTLEGEEVDESKGASKTPIHVKASMVYNAAIKRRELDKLYPKIQEGEKIKFVYLQMPNQFHSPVIAFTNRAPRELQIESCIDYNKQFEKSFLDPLKIILESIEWTTEKAACLEDFFA